MAKKKTLKLRLDRSAIGRMPNHRASVKGLGFRRVGQVVEVEDTPSTRGMYNQVSYLVSIVNES